MLKVVLQLLLHKPRTSATLSPCQVLERRRATPSLAGATAASPWVLEPPTSLVQVTSPSQHSGPPIPTLFLITGLVDLAHLSRMAPTPTELRASLFPAVQPIPVTVTNLRDGLHRQMARLSQTPLFPPVTPCFMRAG